MMHPLHLILFTSLVIHATYAAEAPYVFPPVKDLPEQEGLADPFLKPDGTRLTSTAEWPVQRSYLKAMLAHYQYGQMPPRPGKLRLKKVDHHPVLSGKAIQETYAIHLSRKGKALQFHFCLIRPRADKRYPAIVKNGHVFFEEDNKSGRNDREAARHAVERGYLLCKFNREEVANDKPGNRTSGVFPLYPGYDWGTIAAWAWAHGVVIDALDQLGHADMERLVVTGHSRGGKTALCAGIYDERVAITAPNSSGTGGTGSLRYFETGQKPQQISHHRRPFSHWWVPRFHACAGHENRLPFDAHTAKALIAPRALVNAHARQDYWANPYGTELTARAADVVFEWLNAKGRQGLHWREGGHAQGEEDWLALLDFADGQFFNKPAKRSFTILAYPQATIPIHWKAP